MKQWLGVLQRKTSTYREREESSREALNFFQNFNILNFHEPEKADVKKIAREHGGTVISTLQCLSFLIPQSKEKADDSAEGPVTIFADIACEALDSLDRLKTALKVKGLELETQRCLFVRKFSGIELQHHVISQGWKLYTALQPDDKRALKSTDALELLTATMHCLIPALTDALEWPAEDRRLNKLPLQPRQMLLEIMPDLRIVTFERPGDLAFAEFKVSGKPLSPTHHCLALHSATLGTLPWGSTHQPDQSLPAVRAALEHVRVLLDSRTALKSDVSGGKEGVKEDDISLSRLWRALHGWCSLAVEGELLNTLSASWADLTLQGMQLLVASSVHMATAPTVQEDCVSKEELIHAAFHAGVSAVKALARGLSTTGISEVTSGASSLDLKASGAQTQDQGYEDRICSILEHLQLMLKMLESPSSGAPAGGALTFEDMQWVTSALSNAGHQIHGVGLYRLAAQAFEMVANVAMLKAESLIASSGLGLSEAELRVLVDKRFKAHLIALEKGHLVIRAVEMAEKYIAYANNVAEEASVTLLQTLIKIHGRCRIKLFFNISPPAMASVALEVNGAARTELGACRVEHAAMTPDEQSVCCFGWKEGTKDRPSLLTCALLETCLNGTKNRQPQGARHTQLRSQTSLLNRLDWFACQELAAIERECSQLSSWKGCEPDHSDQNDNLDVVMLNKYRVEAASEICGVLKKGCPQKNFPAQFAQYSLLQIVQQQASGRHADSLVAQIKEIITLIDGSDCDNANITQTHKVVKLNVLAVSRSMLACQSAEIALYTPQEDRCRAWQEYNAQSESAVEAWENLLKSRAVLTIEEDWQLPVLRHAAASQIMITNMFQLAYLHGNVALRRRLEHCLQTLCSSAEWKTVLSRPGRTLKAWAATPCQLSCLELVLAPHTLIETLAEHLNMDIVASVEENKGGLLREFCDMRRQDFAHHKPFV
ncbi:hypothetical protein CEUSTIGMA_g286.t1 [Chlamydomonas eustigma]|uniref:Uncharacterized protein n=1 Tax=Chlamydomonas eustigma TaxID=1157962 RepID=A0A250WPV7_9CHLO|nr:hypothetical protein CEUSTIGMA_g286.t1 [Chlamydomonas eustigma]|eukprot:GAX72831.1 hypothetical protein CEUSTIGMA_g286.t1 [Chlamydomonas eustigma]